MKHRYNHPGRHVHLQSVVTESHFRTTFREVPSDAEASGSQTAEREYNTTRTVQVQSDSRLCDSVKASAPEQTCQNQNSPINESLGPWPNSQAVFGEMRRVA